MSPLRLGELPTQTEVRNLFAHLKGSTMRIVHRSIRRKNKDFIKRVLIFFKTFFDSCLGSQKNVHEMSARLGWP